MRMAVAALLAALLAPTAAALQVDAVGPTEPLAPEVDLATATVTVTVECTTLWSRDGVTVAVGSEAPDHVLVHGPPTFVFDRSDCATPDGVATREAEYDVAVTRNAPADEPLTVTFSAHLHADSLHPEHFASTTIQVVPAYFGRFQVKIASQIKEVGDDPIPFDVWLSNHGNGDGRATFSLAEADAGLRFDFPDNVVLAPGEEREVTMVVHPPKGSWSQATARIQVNTTQDGTGADPQAYHASILVRNGDALERVAGPGPTAVPVLLALVGLAVAARARRR